MAEAEALRAKLEREKQELRDFLEQGRPANHINSLEILIPILNVPKLER